MSTKPIWSPSEDLVAQSNFTSFQKYINSKYNTNLKTYDALHKWSVNSLNEFWSSLIEYEKIIYKGSLFPHIDGDMRMPGTKWYPNMKLNFAQNLLKINDDSIAIESHSESGEILEITFNELNQKVDTCFNYLKSIGVSPGDRVASVTPNISESVILMLSTAKLGAIWTSCSPDFGEEAILDRFKQVSPKVLIATDGYSFKGKYFSIIDKIINVSRQINSLESIVGIDYIKAFEISDNRLQRYSDLMNKTTSTIYDYDVFDFDHPLYIMYSSGTTGKPKSIVHSSGGTLVQHIKELSLHTNIKKGDKVFYYTTCGWMMWNWLVSSLSLGATIVLYDGNPFFPNQDRLLEMASSRRINVFGTSAKYIDSLRLSGCKPGDRFNFDNLDSILSTGSPLNEENFQFVYDYWKKSVQLSSISGGTDIISCFALGNPNLPIYKGDLQCLGLGMNVKSYDENGNSIISEKGELVCETPFPSMPIYFWGDKDGSKYHDAYFTKFKEKWTHGDYISINQMGGVRIFGRSDATLNPGGVRIGTSEIYKVVEKIDGVLDSVAISKNIDGDEKILLFVKMSKELDNEINNLIKQRLRQECSPKHIPYKIFKVDDIPYTLNGKKIELAIKKIIDGDKVSNKSSIVNPESLKNFEKISI